MGTRKIRKTRTKVIALSGALAVIGGVIGTAAAFGTGSPDQPRIEASKDRLTVPVTGGRAVVDLASLAVRARTEDGRTWQLSAPAAGSLGPAGRVSVHGAKATWGYAEKGLTVSASASGGRLVVSVHSDRQATLNWPCLLYTPTPPRRSCRYRVAKACPYRSPTAGGTRPPQGWRARRRGCPTA